MDITVNEALLRLGLAVLVGVAIGFEREWHEKAAGFRTITLVTVGSALFVMASHLGFSATDRARVAAGVVTGIGFLGAGAIIRERGEVVGLTTAATVWAACALGIASAFGEFELVLAGTAVVLVVLVGFPRIDIAESANDARRYEITAPYAENAFDAFEQRFAEAGLRARRKTLTREGGTVVVMWEVSGRPARHAAVTRALLGDEGVLKLEVL